MMEQENETFELILFLYDDARRAGEALQKARQLSKTGELQLVDAAALATDLDGSPSFHELHDLSARKGALFGLISGALVGLLGGPAGALLGGAIGAAMGGAVAGGLDLGFSDEFLSELARALRPGHSALLVIVELPYAEPLQRALEPFPERVLRHLLRAEAVEQLRRAEGGEDA